MGALTYKVKVPQLAKALNIGAMDLVRISGIAVGTAYKAMDENKANDISLDSCWKIFKSLRDANMTINGREIKWRDIVEFNEL